MDADAATATTSPMLPIMDDAAPKTPTFPLMDAPPPALPLTDALTSVKAEQIVVAANAAMELDGSITTVVSTATSKRGRPRKSTQSERQNLKDVFLDAGETLGNRWEHLKECLRHVIYLAVGLWCMCVC